MIGWTPGEAIGKTISTAGMNEGRVIGVMKDYHQHGLQNKIGPVLTFITPAYAYNFIALRTAGNNLSQTIGSVENFWNTRFPGYPFEYFMLDDDFNLQYQAEQRFAKITSLFSILTIIIACLGLFGLAMHATSQRIKEIGIRKLLGASVASITMMLSFDFFKLVILSAFIAFPVGWYIMSNWLSDFAYRVNISWGTFAIAGFIALFIAFVTVSYQAIKSALANPVKSLRTE
jgi:putative ABC transport system permease protein